MAPVYIRLLLIVSLDRIEAATITHEPVSGKFVYRFLRRLVFKQQLTNGFSTDSLVLAMDNCPKNRGDKIKKLENEGLINLMYTTPCSPYTNFIESVFNWIKQGLRKHPEYSFE